MKSPPLSRQPAFKTACLFAAGILLGRFIRPTWGAAHLIVLPAAVLLLGLLFFQLRTRVMPAAGSLAASALSLLLGFAAIALEGADRPVILENLTDRPVVLLGVVGSVPQRMQHRSRFVLEAGQCIDSGRAIPCEVDLLVTVSWRARDSLGRRLEYGDVVALRGVVEPAGEERNPGEFSPRRYYEANGISMLFRVRGLEDIVTIDTTEGAWIMKKIVIPARGFVSSAIDRRVGGEEGELLKGVLIGDRSGMSPATRRSFSNSGVAHVLAVSGSHVVVVVGVISLILDLLRIPRKLRLLPAAAGLIFYLLLTGGRPPVVRATVAAVTFLASTAVQERSNPFNTLGFAALVILAADARQLFDVGFQLSFGAVLSILGLYPALNVWIVKLRGGGGWHRFLVRLLQICAVSAAAMLGTLPLTAIYFGRVSLIGIAANVAVIPGVGVSVILGIISACAEVVSPTAAAAYASLNKLVLYLILEVTQRAGDASFASVNAFGFRSIDALPYYAALLLLSRLSRPKQLPRPLIAFLAALDLALFFPGGAEASDEGVLRISFVDVGQGDACVIQFPNGECMVVDAGPWSQEFDAGERILGPFLARRGIDIIDHLFVSHAHSDHLGGVPYLVRSLGVRRYYEGGRDGASRVSLLVHNELAARGVPADTALMGRAMDGPDGSRIYVLSPRRSSAEQGTGRGVEENTSVVLKLQYRRVSILFTGDAEAHDEGAMVAVYGSFLRSTLLKAGHHGSSTSSTPGFLDAVDPEWAVISVGRYNRFGHPSPDVIRRLKERNIRVVRTDEEGAALFESDGDSVRRILWR